MLARRPSGGRQEARGPGSFAPPGEGGRWPGEGGRGRPAPLAQPGVGRSADGSWPVASAPVPSPGRGKVRMGVEATGRGWHWRMRHSTPTPALPLPGGGRKMPGGARTRLAGPARSAGTSRGPRGRCRSAVRPHPNLPPASGKGRIQSSLSAQRPGWSSRSVLTQGWCSQRRGCVAITSGAIPPESPAATSLPSSWRALPLARWR